jgi:broad specificity phosphatase PhoE
MGEVYLLRHGQTEWSESGRHTGRTDIPLTPQGEERAKQAGRVLAALRNDTPPALVLSSPRTRALHTAELAGLSVDEVTPDLAEWDYGAYEGLTTPQIRETVPGWTVWTHPCPGGESPDDVTTRAVRVLAIVRPLLTRGDVILVGHGQFSRALIVTWLTQPASSGVHFRLDPAGIAVLGTERGVPAIHHLNIPPLA